jgi:hypothetical protein
VTPKNSVVASWVVNVSPTYSKKTIRVNNARHLRGEMGDSLNTRASRMTVDLSW